MKCKKCKEHISNEVALCPYCGEKISFTIGLLNCVLMLFMIIQIIIFTIFITSLLNSKIVLNYIEKEEYGKAIDLISKNDVLAENEEIFEMVKDMVIEILDGYIVDNAVTYDTAILKINKLSYIDQKNYQQLFSTASEMIYDEYYLDEASKFKREGDYISALICYNEVDSSNYPYYIPRIELKENVYSQIYKKFIEYESNKNYSQIIYDINYIYEIEIDEVFFDRLYNWKKMYLSKWIQYEIDNNNFVGEESAFSLSVEYDYLVKGSQKVNNIDGLYQKYINNQIEKGKFEELIYKLESDENEIKKYPDYFNFETYENYKIIIATTWLDKCKKNNNYTGENGVFQIADKINSYKANSINKDSLIQEYIENNKNVLINWINSQRKNRNLPTMQYNSILEVSANEILINVIDYEYDDEKFKEKITSILNQKNKEWWQYSCIWNKNDSNAENVIKSFVSLDDYTIFTDSELTDVGIGFLWNEESETFSWLIIGIK